MELGQAHGLVCSLLREQTKIFNQPKKKRRQKYLMDKEQIEENETVRDITRKLIERLDELKDIGPNNENQFAYGEKTAYAECSEWIQKKWKGAKKNGLDFDIEERYPL